MLNASTTDSNKILTFLPLSALFVAVFAIAAAPLFIRIGEQEISPLATAFDRFWLTAALLALWNGIGKVWYSLSSARRDNPISDIEDKALWSSWAVVAAAGLFFALDLSLWSWSLSQTSVANATLLANLTPVFSTLGACLFLKKRFDWQFVLGTAIAFAGVTAVMLSDFVLTPEKLIGDLAALCAAVSFCFYLFILEKLQTQLSITDILFYSALAAALFTLPVSLIYSDAILPHSWVGWTAVVALALVCQILGQGLLTQSLKFLSAEFVALFLLLDPVLAAVGANIFLNERLNLVNWIEFSIVLLGISIAFLSSTTRKPVALADC